jgi:excisionase family DNA binding protein
MEYQVTSDQMPSMLTVPEVQQFLRIGKVKTYDLIKQGIIPSIKLGATIRVPRDIFLHWIDEQESGDTGAKIVRLPRAERR